MRSSSDVRVTKPDEEEEARGSCVRPWGRGEIPEREMPPPPVNWRHWSCCSITVSITRQRESNGDFAVNIPLLCCLGAS